MMESRLLFNSSPVGLLFQSVSEFIVEGCL